MAGSEDDPVLTKVLLDQFEAREADQEDPWVLEGQGWIGQDLKKIWFKTEVERAEGETEEAELQVLYSKAVSTFWDFQVGIRHGQNDEDTGVDSGLSDIQTGLRLRYEIRREFAPYIGINWNKKYGNSADFARLENEDIEDWQWVLGIRAWF
jgi:uncharacterized protein involved in copper resistance